MRKGPLIVCAAAAFLLVCCALLFGRPFASGADDAIVQAPAATSGPLTIADEQESYVLFANVAAASVTGLSLTMPEYAYVFGCTDAQRVSVNGQKADRDVFCTLLDQVLTMPVVTIAPFTPTSDATLTLTLDTGSAQYTVLFFREEDTESPYVSLISGEADNPCYQRTDRWRLGTMLLACEGTRIQDEKGEETPFTD